MVYSNKFIVAIKHKGKVLREFNNNVVQLPFGSDYSLMLKNKENRKALVEVKVDGQDVLNGNSIIIGPNGTTELKGFMKGSKVTNKFRFIERTDAISKYRGNLVEDGLVEVTYRFEERQEPDWVMPYWTSPSDIKYGASCSTLDCSTPRAKATTTRHCNFVSDTGITVPGKETRQDFVTGTIGRLESFPNKIILNLKGEVKRKKIQKPVTVKTKITCPTCGHRWKSSQKYCGNCSTSLHY